MGPSGIPKDKTAQIKLKRSRVLHADAPGKHSPAIVIESLDPPAELLERVRFLRSQGIDPGKVDPEKYFQRMPHFAETRQEAGALIQPRAILNFLPVQQIREEKILLQGGGAVESPLIASLLNSASEVVLAVATLGDSLEKRVEQYFAKGDSSRAFALDGWGTTALVSFGRKLYRRLQAMAEERKTNLSISFSPGHTEWPLEQQEVLFKLLPTEKIGVRLTDSYLMIPKKSTSFMAGLGKRVVSAGSKCDYCPRQKQCLFRQS